MLVCKWTETNSESFMSLPDHLEHTKYALLQVEGSYWWRGLTIHRWWRDDEYGLGGERDATNATCTKLRWDGMVMIRWIGVCACAYSTGTFFVNTNDGSGGSNVQIHGPSLLSESIAPCTLPITRNLRARKDAVTRNLPILLLSIVILAFLPSSWLLLMAGPSISPSKIQMGVQVAQKRGKANSQLTYRISCEMNSGCIAATGARKHLFLRRYGQSSLCERR